MQRRGGQAGGREGGSFPKLAAHCSPLPVPEAARPTDSPPPPRRSLVLKCSSYRQARWWAQEIAELAQARGQDCLRLHRFDSFVPAREETPTRW